MRFAGTEPRGPRGQAIYTRREEFNGGLARVIEDCWAILLQEMRGEAVVRGLKREDRHVYPALRRARSAGQRGLPPRLPAHRQAASKSASSTTGWRSAAPAACPATSPLDNIVEEHFSRNPRLVNGLFEWGYIEQLGLGIDRMIEEMVQAGHPAAGVQADALLLHGGPATRQRRRRTAARAVPEWATGLNERQIRAMQYLQQYGRITNREYHELCPDVSPETLRLDLADLVDKGLVVKIGDKKGTYYMLK